MQRVVEELTKALEYCDNEHQKNMLEKYIQSFTDGDVEAHIEGSRHWIKDKVRANFGSRRTPSRQTLCSKQTPYISCLGPYCGKLHWLH
jgi:hypothetical protein